MGKESSRFNKFKFIYSVEEWYDILKRIVEDNYNNNDDSIKRLFDKLNVIERIIKKEGLEYKVKFSSLHNIYTCLNNAGYFETNYQYDNYRKQYIQESDRKAAWDEFINLQRRVLIDKNTLEKIITQAKYHDAKGCELIYKLFKQLHCIAYDEYKCLSDDDWDTYIHSIELYKQLRQAGIKNELINRTVYATDIDARIYDYEDGDKGTPLLDITVA